MQPLNFSVSHEGNRFHKTGELGWKWLRSPAHAHVCRDDTARALPGVNGLCRPTMAGPTSLPGGLLPLLGGQRAPQGQGAMGPECTFHFCSRTSQHLRHGICTGPRSSGKFQQSQSLEFFLRRFLFFLSQFPPILSNQWHLPRDRTPVRPSSGDLVRAPVCPRD